MHLYTYVYKYKKELVYIIFIKKTLTVNESCHYLFLRAVVAKNRVGKKWPSPIIKFHSNFESLTQSEYVGKFSDQSDDTSHFYRLLENLYCCTIRFKYYSFLWQLKLCLIHHSYSYLCTKNVHKKNLTFLAQKKF